ncbi:hypothetical protein AB0L02_14580 [Streptomyces anulatus]|uniref:hypothetical protein n=1 Tax=Streptomyces anulatus TaxID=1892 RepID=UPI00342CF117
MTNPASSVPEDLPGDPDFLLWHPVCTDTRSGYTCTFDVTASDFEEINSGTDFLISAFVTRLGMDASRISSWRIERFLSPYYSFEVRPEQRIFGTNLPTTGDWVDRFGLAWRTSVTFAGGIAPFRYGCLGPSRVVGHDETWSYRSTVTGPGNQEETVVVLADCWGVEDWSFLDEFVSRDKVEVASIATPVEQFAQARVRLDSVRPIDVEGAVVELLQVFTGRLFSTHHKVTEEIPFWPESPTEP